MSNTGTYYAVLLHSKVSDKDFLAYSGTSEAPMLFYKYRKAVDFRNELQKHITSKGKVVKVRAEFSVLSRV